LQRSTSTGWNLAGAPIIIDNNNTYQTLHIKTILAKENKKKSIKKNKKGENEMSGMNSPFFFVSFSLNPFCYDVQHS